MPLSSMPSIAPKAVIDSRPSTTGGACRAQHPHGRRVLSGRDRGDDNKISPPTTSKPSLTCGGSKAVLP